MHRTFGRGGCKVHVEAWFVVVDGRYALRVLWQSGLEQCDTFCAEAPLRQPLMPLETQLAQEDWLEPSMMNDVVDDVGPADHAERRARSGDRRLASRTDRRKSAPPSPNDQSERSRRLCSEDDA